MFVRILIEQLPEKLDELGYETVFRISWKEPSTMKNSPIIALDFASAKDAYQFLTPFEESLFVKVGMELYLQEGPSIVYKIERNGS